MCPAPEARIFRPSSHERPCLCGELGSQALDGVGARQRIDDFGDARLVLENELCVSDAKHFACSGFLRNEIDSSRVSIAKHELQRVDMSLKQPPQRQAAPSNRAQHFA